MIAQVLNRGFMESQLEDLAQALENRRLSLQAGDVAASARAEAHGVSEHDLEVAREAVLDLKQRGLQAGGLSSAWISRDPVASVLQSALEQFFIEAGAVEQQPAQSLAAVGVAVTDVSLRPAWMAQSKQGLLAQFDKSDARWALDFLAARGLARLRGQHPFPAAPPAQATIANKARLLLVGDWGSGLPRARKVAEHMRAALLDNEGKSRERHVVHLGDVYYAGFEHEYESRFLPHWPVEPDEAGEIGSWCLNGNHDMFTGGYGYFDFLLQEPRFARHGGASYFCLENDHWQIFGLDSAYDLHGLRGEEGDLWGPQAAWVALRRAASPKKKAVLLSHHQLFSAYEGGSPRMEARLRPVLQVYPATAWFWGHEHLCAAYAPHPLVRHARLIGHGGVPVAPRQGALPGDVQYELRDSLLSGLNRFTRFGFAVLDFDEGKVGVRYVNELGATHHAEVVE